MGGKGQGNRRNNKDALKHRYEERRLNQRGFAELRRICKRSAGISAFNQGTNRINSTAKTMEVA